MFQEFHSQILTPWPLVSMSTSSQKVSIWSSIMNMTSSGILNYLTLNATTLCQHLFIRLAYGLELWSCHHHVYLNTWPPISWPPMSQPYVDIYLQRSASHFQSWMYHLLICYWIWLCRCDRLAMSKDNSVMVDLDPKFFLSEISY